MSQDTLAKLECSNCKRIGHYTTRNKKKLKNKLEMKKFCKWCHKHTLHKEIK